MRLAALRHRSIARVIWPAAALLVTLGLALPADLLTGTLSLPAWLLVAGLALGLIPVLASSGQRQALRAKQAELRAALDASPLGLFQTDAKGRCTWVNRRYESISGLSAECAVGEGWISAVHPQDRIKVFRAWHESTGSAAAAACGPISTIYRFVRPDGSIAWVSVKTAPVLINGVVQGYTGTVDDITARRESEQALADSERRLRTVADALPALIAYVDRHRICRFLNRAWESRSQTPVERLQGQHLSNCLGQAQYSALLPHIEMALAGQASQLEREIPGEAGAGAWETLHFIPHVAKDELEVAGFHLMVQDTSAQKHEQIRLRELAEKDSLTGVFNREGFQRRLEDALERSRRRPALLALMFLDLDRFKLINDTHGHHVGDLLLRAFAGRLRQALRTTDIIGRMGGDEFTVVMEDLSDPQDAKAIAAKIVQALRTPFLLDGKAVSVGVSAGLSFCRGSEYTATQLLQSADALLYGAKEDGRNRFHCAPHDEKTANAD